MRELLKDMWDVLCKHKLSNKELASCLVGAVGATALGLAIGYVTPKTEKQPTQELTQAYVIPTIGWHSDYDTTDILKPLPADDILGSKPGHGFVYQMNEKDGVRRLYELAKKGECEDTFLFSPKLGIWIDVAETIDKMTTRIHPSVVKRYAAELAKQGERKVVCYHFHPFISKDQFKDEWNYRPPGSDDKSERREELKNDKVTAVLRTLKALDKEIQDNQFAPPSHIDFDCAAEQAAFEAVGISPSFVVVDYKGYAWRYCSSRKLREEIAKDFTDIYGETFWVNPERYVEEMSKHGYSISFEKIE